MPEQITLNEHDTRTFDKAIREFTVGVGSIVVSRKIPQKEGEVEIESTTVNAGDSYDGEDTASLAIYSPDGARVGITYADEPQEAETASESASGVSVPKRSKK